MPGFLFVDHITELTPGKITRGVKHVTNQDPYCTTIQNETVFWPSLIGETLGQLCAWNVMSVCDFQKRPVAGMCREVIIHDHARVGDTLELFSEILSLDEQTVLYNAHASVNGKIIFEMKQSLGPLLPMSDFISDQEIRQQFADIYPGTHQVTETAAVELVNEDYDNVYPEAMGEVWRAEKFIDGNARYFPDHFPRKPVLPLTVLLHCYANLGTRYIQAIFPNEDLTNLRVTKLSKIKMSRFVEPGMTIESKVKLLNQTERTIELEFSTFLEDRRICVVRTEFIF